MVRYGKRDSSACVHQPGRLGLVAAAARGQDQPETLFGRQALVILGQRWSFHLSLSFRESNTASSAAVRLNRSSTARAPNRASASVAVRRDFSATGRSADSTCRNRAATIFTTSAVVIGASSPACGCPFKRSASDSPRKAWSSTA